MNATTGANRPTFDEFKARCRKLGEDAGKGKDAYVGHLIQCMESTYHGACDLDNKDKHGKGIDDIRVLVGEYVHGAGKASQFKNKTGGERKVLSNSRKLGKLGVQTKWGAGEPLRNVSDLMIRRNRLAATTAVDDAANSLLRYATAQLRSETLIEGEALEQFCKKNAAPQRKTKAVLKGVIKTLQKLDDSSTELVQAAELLNARVNALTAEEVAARQEAQEAKTE